MDPNEEWCNGYVQRNDENLKPATFALQDAGWMMWDDDGSWTTEDWTTDWWTTVDDGLSILLEDESKYPANDCWKRVLKETTTTYIVSESSLSSKKEYSLGID